MKEGNSNSLVLAILAIMEGSQTDDCENQDREKLQSGHQRPQDDFRGIFQRQMDIQLDMLKNGLYESFRSQKENCLPVDDVRLFSYHIQQLMSEIGEVLEADKRWKNARNDKFDRNAKLEELCDCMIVLINVIAFSGFSFNEFMSALTEKQKVVEKRLKAKGEKSK